MDTKKLGRIGCVWPGPQATVAATRKPLQTERMILRPTAVPKAEFPVRWVHVMVHGHAWRVPKTWG